MFDMRYRKIGNRRVPIPQSRTVRMGSGVMLLSLGFLGFLPILGFWLIPVGLAVLSMDIPYLRRKRRRALAWWRLRQTHRSTGENPSPRGRGS